MLSNFIAPDSADPRLNIKARYQMLVDGKSRDAASGKTIDRVSPGHAGVVVGTWPDASADDVRMAIAAARRASETFDSWTRRRIDTILARQTLAMEAHDHNAFRREDEQFHIAIAEGAGCGLAWNAISDIKAHMDRVCNLQLRHPDSMTRLIAEHQAIITAIDTRDADAAATAMRAHLNGILADLPQIEANHPDLFE